MKYSEYKCSAVIFLCVACVLSVLVIAGALMSVMLAYLFDGFDNFGLVALIAALIIVFIWLVMSLSLVLSRKRIVVTEEDITLYRWHKVKWHIKKDEIMELIFYDTLKWYMFVLPISELIAPPELCIRLNNGKVSQKYRCYLSKKNAEDISKTFGYALRIVGN